MECADLRLLLAQQSLKAQTPGGGIERRDKYESRADPFSRYLPRKTLKDAVG